MSKGTPPSSTPPGVNEAQAYVRPGHPSAALAAPARRRKLAALGLRLLAAGAAVTALVLLWQTLRAEELHVVARVVDTIGSLRGNPWALPVVLLAFVIGSLVAVPITLLIGTTIFTFGPGQGFVWAATGTLLGAIAGWAVGRLAGRSLMSRLLGQHLERFDRKLDGCGILTVALIRKLPLAPFTVVNLLLGASAVRLTHFVAGTALGMVPAIGAFALLGDRLVHVWNHPTPFNVAVVAAVVAAWISLIVGLQVWVNRASAAKARAA